MQSGMHILALCPKRLIIGSGNYLRRVVNDLAGCAESTRLSLGLAIAFPGCLKRECDVAEKVDANQINENLSGVAIRCGQDRPDEYGKTDGQDVKRGVIHNTPIISHLQVRILPSRSLNIPRPPRVDGGGLPLCGTPLTNAVVLQRDRTTSIME